MKPQSLSLSMAAGFRSIYDASKSVCERGRGRGRLFGLGRLMSDNNFID